MPLIEGTVVLTGDEAELPLGVPLFGWESAVTVSNISATQEDPDFPATNLANTATNLEWRGQAADSPPVALEITVTGVGLVDYLGLARHNFGDAAITAEVGYYDNDSPDNWVSLAGPYLSTDNEPLLFWFTAETLTSITLKMTAGTEVARAAVMYVGKLLLAERGLDVNTEFTIPHFARKVDVVNGRSARGDYLGSIVLSRYTAGANIIFKHFTPTWYREFFDPFVLHAQSHHPFFYAWHPSEYESEVAFCWLADDPEPMVSPITDRVGVTLKVDGILT